MNINDIRSYIGNNNFKIILTNKYINIINFEETIEISNNKIIIKNDNKIVINGTSLEVIKLLDNEILLKGKIKSINYE